MSTSICSVPKKYIILQFKYYLEMNVIVGLRSAFLVTSTQKHYTGGSQPLFTGGLENRLRWVPVEIKSFHRRVT